MEERTRLRCIPKKPAAIVGFHGCDLVVQQQLLSQTIEMKESNNDHDWLGPGMYFWDGSPDRAQQWAENQKRRGKITTPAVVGCVIDLGFCLDFLDFHFLQLLKPAYYRLKSIHDSIGSELPNNTSPKGSNENILHFLDCAVIKMIHQDRDDSNKASFDSVRGVFWEGSPPYETSAFREKNHIQIAVRNPNCLKGFFLPRGKNESWPIP